MSKIEMTTDFNGHEGSPCYSFKLSKKTVTLFDKLCQVIPMIIVDKILTKTDFISVM